MDAAADFVFCLGLKTAKLMLQRNIKCQNSNRLLVKLARQNIRLIKHNKTKKLVFG